MANDVTVKKTLDDGFAGYSDEVEGEDGRSADRSIPILKYSNDNKWLCNEEELPPDRKYMIGKVGREMVHWVNGLPSEKSYTLEPGQPFPDVEALNEEEPQELWYEDPSGKMVGPWQAQHVTFLLDVDDMSKYRFPTNTVGGGIATRVIVDKVKDKRRFEPGAFPIVQLRTTWMKTRFGGRLRPHFHVDHWITFDDGTPAALPSPSTQPQLDKSAAEQPAPAAKTVTPSGERKYTVSTGAPPTEEKPKTKKAKGARTISEPTLAQEMDDEIPM
jgi:hypothetical protein